MKPLKFTTPPQRILIIKPSAIGDIVHALPVLNLLRLKWPTAKISWLVSSACASLLEGHPQIDELIHFDRRRFGKGWRKPAAAVDLFRFAVDLRQRKFDLAIDLQGLFRSGWLAKKTHAKMRVGPAEARELGWMFYTHPIKTGWPEGHAVDRYLKIAEALGLGREPVKFVLASHESDRQAAAKLVPEGQRFAILLPGANWETKRWPPDKFAALVGPLKELGLTTYVAGASADSKLAAQIPGAIDLCGKTNLRQLVALMERAAIVIGNDTGPVHIAAALGRPMVAIYGPTKTEFTGPYGHFDSVVRLQIECSPCFSRYCSHQSCLRNLDSGPVLAEIQRQLRTAGEQNPRGLPILAE